VYHQTSRNSSTEKCLDRPQVSGTGHWNTEQLGRRKLCSKLFGRLKEQRLPADCDHDASGRPPTAVRGHPVGVDLVVEPQQATLCSRDCLAGGGRPSDLRHGAFHSPKQPAPAPRSANGLRLGIAWQTRQ